MRVHPPGRDSVPPRRWTLPVECLRALTIFCGDVGSPAGGTKCRAAQVVAPGSVSLGGATLLGRIEQGNPCITRPQCPRVAGCSTPARCCCTTTSPWPPIPRCMPDSLSIGAPHGQLPQAWRDTPSPRRHRTLWERANTASALRAGTTGTAGHFIPQAGDNTPHEGRPTLQAPYGQQPAAR